MEDTPEETSFGEFPELIVDLLKYLTGISKFRIGNDTPDDSDSGNNVACAITVRTDSDVHVEQHYAS